MMYHKWYRQVAVFLLAVGFLSLLPIFLPFSVAEAEDTYVSNTSSVLPGKIELVTKGADGLAVYAEHIFPSMAEDGSFVFVSKATNLVTPPTNAREYRYYFYDNPTKKLTVLPPLLPDMYLIPSITPDKAWIFLHAYLYNTSTGEFTTVAKADGTLLAAAAAEVTGDGSVVAITTLKKLVPEDTNTKYDLYLWHRATKEVQFIPTTSSVNGIERDFTLSDDGQFVAYVVRGSSSPACGSRADDIYRKNVITGEVICLTEGIDDSDGEYFNSPQMSADGSLFLVNGMIYVGVNPQMNGAYLINVNGGTTTTLFTKSELSTVGSYRLTADGKLVIYDKLNFSRNQIAELCTYEISTATHSCISKPQDIQAGYINAISPTGRYSVIASWDHSWIGSVADNFNPTTQGRPDDLFIWDRDGVNNTISGKVTGDDGVTGLANVTLTNGSREKYLTDASGTYSMPYLNAGQTYEVTPTLFGKTFYPAKRLVAAPSGSVDFSTKNPVQSVAVFIPGVTGSTQISEGGNDLWPGLSTIAGLLFGDTYKRLSLESGSIEPNIIAGDAIRVASLPFDFQTKPVVKNLVNSTIVYKPFLDYMVNELGYREYLVEDDPKRRKASEGCQDKEQASLQPNLFVFAYDWRKDITENSALLGEYIGCIHKFYPGIKVTLIGHSMGGLLARKYVASGGESNVKMLITINTPWLGAPKVLQTMLDGNWQTPYSRPILKQLVKYFPGAYQLIPSARYLSSVSLPPFREGDSDLDTDGVINESYQNVNDFTGFFNALGYTTLPYDVNSAFFDNKFFDPATGSSVPHFSLFTVQNGNTTSGQIYNETELVCSTGSNGDQFTCSNISFYTVQAVRGDGTVPFDSLVGLSKAKIGTTTWFASPGSRFDHYYGHKEATGNTHVLAAITNLLTGNTEVLAASDEVVTDNISRYVRLMGVEALTITHPISGNISTTDHTLDFFSFPDVSVSQEGEDGYVITMAPDAIYSITYKASKPVFLQTNISDGGSEVQVSQSFNNQPRPANGELTLHISGNAEASLTYLTSQGVMEVQPTGRYTGTSPVDETAPVVTIKQTENGHVEVTAVDDSAVLEIYVSTNNTLYQVYSQPLLVPSGTIVTAFADDIVGNRSKVVSYTVQTQNSTLYLYLPLVQR